MTDQIFLIIFFAAITCFISLASSVSYFSNASGNLHRITLVCKSCCIGKLLYIGGTSLILSKGALKMKQIKYYVIKIFST